MHRNSTIKLIQNKEKFNGELELDGKSLTIAHIHGLHNFSKVVLSKESRNRMQDNVDFFQEKLKGGACIYGANTGYGGSADVRSENGRELQRSLIRHLNAGFGDTLPSDLVRAVMLVRSNSLALGYSGIRPQVVDLLLELLNNDLIPIVPKRGSVSASGDLMPTSYIASCMMGRPDSRVLLKGKEMSAPEALNLLNLKPVIFEEKEALAVINAGSFASSLGASVLYDANIAALLTQVATALTVEAMQGRVESFHPRIHTCLAHPGQQEVAANIRSLLEGSCMVADPKEHDPGQDKPGVLKQDRYALRSSPQWLGPTVETLLESQRRITTEINSANDNPLIDHEAGLILHGANFQAVSVTVAMDQARQSVQLCGKLLFGQMQELTNVNLSNGLPPNLAGSNINTDFGFKGMDTAMASYMSELDYLTNSVTNHVLSAELHNQSVNSMGLVSARYTEQAVELLQMMIANIFCAQAQALDLRWLKAEVEKAMESIRIEYSMPENALHPKVWPWYNFAYLPEETSTLFLDAFLTNSHKQTLIDRITSEMKALTSKMVKGNHIEEVEKTLGKGTKVMYTFIRSTLNVPFNSGKEYPDSSLQSIFTAIKDTKVEKIIKDIFDL